VLIVKIYFVITRGKVHTVHKVMLIVASDKIKMQATYNMYVSIN